MFPRVSRAFRAVRIRRRWRQVDIADRARVSRSEVSKAECGQIDGITIATLMRIADALEVHLDLVPRWQGGELDRLLDAKHAALAERVAAELARFAGWVLAPEVSFAIYRERGRIDILAWHPATRSLLIGELKTELSDMQDTLGTIDMKRRLAKEIARQRGWYPRSASVWLVISGNRTNRRRAAAHGTILRAAFPAPDGRQRLRRWLAAPVGTVAAMTFWPDTTTAGIRPGLAPIRRVRRSPGEGRSLVASVDGPGRNESPTRCGALLRDE